MGKGERSLESRVMRRGSDLEYFNAVMTLECVYTYTYYFFICL